MRLSAFKLRPPAWVTWPKDLLFSQYERLPRMARLRVAFKSALHLRRLSDF
jgi:hypothetical protein